jgi:NAD(P)-dependent dehydrogenase (short-subunit alcohol dehydrogenase family)
LSKELGPKNIRVNSVSPGPVSTAMWLDVGGVAGASGQTAEDVRTATAGAMATGRFTTPEEVANLVVFLASDRSANITGSDLRIDGGLITTI